MPCMAAIIGSTFLVIEASSKRTEAPLIEMFWSCGISALKSGVSGRVLHLLQLVEDRHRNVCRRKAEPDGGDVAAREADS